MNDLAFGTHLSPYALEVWHDFFSATTTTTTTTTVPEQRLVEIHCAQSAHVFAFNREALQSERERGETADKKATEATLRKQIVARREAELDKRCRQGLISAREKDYTLLTEFVGWAQTTGGHFIYVYYTGPAQRQAPVDLRRPENWRPVDKNHLAMFHRRLGKDVSRFYQYASTDVTTTADGNNHLELDMRYILHKWLNSKLGEEKLPLLRQNVKLFVRGSDYVQQQQQQQQQQQKRAPPAPKPALPSWKPPVFEDGIDPYEVQDEALRYVGASEYARLSEWPLEPAVRCEFSDFVDVSRRAVMDRQQPQQPTYYEHDPIALFDAMCISCNPHMQARRTVSGVTHDHLQVVHNHNVASVIDYMTQQPDATEAVKTRSEEFVWAAMTVENASRVLPERIRELLK